MSWARMIRLVLLIASCAGLVVVQNNVSMVSLIRSFDLASLDDLFVVLHHIGAPCMELFLRCLISG